MKAKRVVKPLLSIVLALVVGAVVIALMGQNPLYIYSTMLQGAFGSPSAVAGTLVKTTTMIFVGLSYGFAYKCGLINIGIEGQLYMGALFSVYTAIYLNLPAVLEIPVCLAAGFIGGGIWGGIVAWLKNRFKASELITTVMMNYVATYIVGALLNGPLKESRGTFPQSEPIQQSAQLPVIVPQTQLTIGFLIAIAAIVCYAIYWKKSSTGFQMSVIGSNHEAARYAGIPVKRMALMAMFISGGLGGLAGTMEVLGVQHKIMEGLSAGYGFDGIAVSLLGNNSGIGIFFSSLLFGALRYGGNAVQMFTGLPIAVIYILQALVILFVVVGTFASVRNKRKKKMLRKPEGA